MLIWAVSICLTAEMLHLIWFKKFSKLWWEHGQLIVKEEKTKLIMSNLIHFLLSMSIDSVYTISLTIMFMAGIVHENWLAIGVSVIITLLGLSRKIWRNKSLKTYRVYNVIDWFISVGLFLTLRFSL